MKLRASLLAVAAAGLLFGASLIGLWCLGLAIIVESGGVGAIALLWDDGARERPQAQTLEQVLERARQAR